MKKKFVYIFIAIILLLIIVIRFFFIGASYHDVSKVYLDNKHMLEIIVTSVLNDSLFTRLAVRKKNVIEKIWTLDFRKELIVRIEYNLGKKGSCGITLFIEPNNFTEIIEKYFESCKTKNDNSDPNKLKSIITFMYNNKIEVISKSFENDSAVRFAIGFETGLYYDKLKQKDSNIGESVPIDDNWSFIKYK